MSFSMVLSVFPNDSTFVHGSVVDIGCVEMLEVGIRLPVREMSLEIEQILIESFKFGIKIMYGVWKSVNGGG